MPRKRKRSRSRNNAPAPRADYDATQDKRKRTAPRSSIKSEDVLLTSTKRRQLTATAQDQIRNFAVAAWMVRKHTAYVSRFVFHASTDDPGFETALEDYIAHRSHAAQFDAGGRLNRQKALTLTERHAVVDGDHFWHLLRDGRTQLVEGDLVWTPHDLPPAFAGRKWIHGVEVDSLLKPKNYCLCTRDGSSRRFGMVARPWNVLQRAYWPRANTVRGVRPLSSALNTLQDLYEGFDYQLIKSKLHALFGVAILTDETDGVGGFDVSETQTTGSEADDDDGTVTHEIETNFIKPGVASILNLPTTSKIELLESKTPSAEFRDYAELSMQIALLAVDLPYIFFNAKDGSFSIHRTAKLEYEKSCKEKRDDNISLLDSWTFRQVVRGIEDGEFSIPARMELDRVRWEWVPEAVPWFNEMDEIDAAIKGMAAGLIDPYRWTKEHGHGDGNHVLEQIAKFQAYGQQLGLQLEWAGQPVVQLTAPRTDR